MENDSKGRFSSALMSLQLQLKSLLDDAGGDHVVSLLDSLCTLTSAEQEIALKIMKVVVDRLSSRDERLLSAKDEHMKELEEFLYNDIVNSFESHASRKTAKKGTRKLAVVTGGKGTPAPEPSQPICLAERRAKKSTEFKPILN